MQPFDGAEFDKRYDEIYKPAIEEAGFEPYRVDKDPSATILIEYIEQDYGQDYGRLPEDYGDMIRIAQSRSAIG